MLILIKENVSENDLPILVEEIFWIANLYRIWCFKGNLGSGKTTFIKHLCKLLGIENVSSPSFSLINSYFSSIVGEVLHFDFYRINTLDEAIDLGTEEFLLSGNLCLLEWAEKIKTFLPERFVEIEISLCNLTHRNYKVYLYGGKNENGS